MAFADQFLDELRARVGLADLISRRVRLARKGREHLGLCPFHKEKTPSFTVNEEKGFYHCFGCGAHGSAFDFLMQTDGVSFPEAVERLAQEAGMEMPRDTPEERERARRSQSLHEAMEAAATFFEKSLQGLDGRDALAYLIGRGMTEAAMKHFRIGYAPDARGALKVALARSGIDEDLMVAAGLMKRPDDGRPPYDYFRGRIMFPITDRRGRVIAFGGRVLETDDSKGGGAPRPGAKYLNSPETGLFSKGRVLYGLAQAQAAAREKGALIVTEGYMDVIALHQAGFNYAVAPLGTALTEDQIREAWRLVAEPVLCFDGDAAGARAAGRAAERALPLLKPGFGLRIAQLPAGEDPDSLVNRDGADAFARVMASAQPLSDVLWQMETRGRMITGPEDRAALQKRLEDHVRRIADPTVRSHFFADVTGRLRALRPTQRMTRRPPPAPAASLHLDAKTGPATKMDPVRLAQRILLAIVVNHPEFFHQVEERLGSVEFADGALDRLRQGLISVLSGETGWDVPRLRAGLDERGLSAPVEGLFRDPLVRNHRLIAPEAAEEDVAAAWEENFSLLSTARLAEEKERVRETLTDDLTPAAWERNQARIRAALEDEA